MPPTRGTSAPTTTGSVRPLVLDAIIASNGPVAVADLATQLGLPRNQVTTALRWLVHTGFACGLPNGRVRYVDDAEADTHPLARQARLRRISHRLLALLDAEAPRALPIDELVSVLQVPLLTAFTALGRLERRGLVTRTNGAYRLR